MPIRCHFIQCFIPDGITHASKIVEEESSCSRFVSSCEQGCGGGPLLLFGGWRGVTWFGLGIPWKHGVTGGLRILVGAEYHCVHL